MILSLITGEQESEPWPFHQDQTSHVDYSYGEMFGSANHCRLESIPYPSGRTTVYNYAAKANDAMNRPTSLSNDSGTLKTYDYPGSSAVVRRAQLGSADKKTPVTFSSPAPFLPQHLPILECHHPTSVARVV